MPRQLRPVVSRNFECLDVVGDALPPRRLGEHVRAFFTTPNQRHPAAKSTGNVASVDVLIDRPQPGPMTLPPVRTSLKARYIRAASQLRQPGDFGDDVRGPPHERPEQRSDRRRRSGHDEVAETKQEMPLLP